MLLPLSPAALSLQTKTNETTNASGVLGRTDRLNELCDDFEDTNWSYNYQNHISNNRLWRSGSGRGEPELLKRVTTPDGGKNGSTGALEIRTGEIDRNDDSDPPGDPSQEDFLTVEFKQKVERELTRADQPVFIVHVWLPSFDQWGDYYSFGFRHECYSNNSPKYYPSIWLRYNAPNFPGANFFFRIGTIVTGDIYGGPIKQPGWWTLAIAFDENGIGHYYACPGTDVPTEKNKVFATTQFITKDGTANPTMDSIGYSFFSLGYPISGNTSPRFIIDDYEVWVAKKENTGK